MHGFHSKFSRIMQRGPGTDAHPVDNIIGEEL